MWSSQSLRISSWNARRGTVGAFAAAADEAATRPSGSIAPTTARVASARTIRDLVVRCIGVSFLSVGAF
jgi:hypothetical protein